MNPRDKAGITKEDADPCDTLRQSLGHKANNKQENNNNTNNCIQVCSSRFFTISLLRRELTPTRTLKWPMRNPVKITCNTSSAYHVQRVVCLLVGRDSSAIKFDRAEIVFILALLYWLKPLIDELNKPPSSPLLVVTFSLLRSLAPYVHGADMMCWGAGVLGAYASTCLLYRYVTYQALGVHTYSLDGFMDLF